MNSENVEIRIQHLADALRAVTAPLMRLSEYKENLESLISDHQVTEAECIAALIRVEAGSVRDRLATTLDAVQEAATKVASL